MRKINVTLILLCLSMLIAKSQTGNEFWLAAPDISSDHANDSRPLYLYVTALHETVVAISRPADDSFTPVEYELAANETKIIQLDNNADFGNFSINEIETYARDISSESFIQSKGFLIESSDGAITACYGPDNGNNSDIISLKAENALGTDFWVSTQRKYKNYPYDDDYSGFTVVATEDNTTITIYPNDNTLEFFESESSVTVTLDKGECFAMQADYETGQDAANHIFGVHVTSTKDIAIIYYDDSMTMDDYSTLGYYSSWDIMADQIVPTSLIGEEYIALRGWVWDRSTTDVDGEAVFVTPTVDGTDIYINGTLMASNLDAGDYFEYTIEDAATHIRGTQPIYVNHVTGYAYENSYTIENASRELGGAVLPSVDLCAGSYSVTVRKEEASRFAFYFNKLIVRCDTSGDPTEAINGFTYYIDDVNQGQIDPDHFTFIMDSAFAYYDPSKAIDLGELPYYENVEDEQTLRVENSSARFHLGVVYASKSPGCRYAYFSDYANSEPDAGIGGFLGPQKKIVCNLDSIQLVASGGTSYTWSTPHEEDLINNLSATDVADPYFYPDSARSTPYYFRVEIESGCWGTETFDLIIYVLQTQDSDADFEIADTIGCSPFSTYITNTSVNIDESAQQIYTFYDMDWNNLGEINQDTVDLSFESLSLKNTSDSIQQYIVSLKVAGAYDVCPAYKYDTVSVLPQVYIEANSIPQEACAPAAIKLQTDSFFNVDTIRWVVTFSDSIFSVLTDTTPYTYTIDSIEGVSQAYSIWALGNSIYGCSDTSSITSLEVYKTPVSDFSFSENPVFSGTDVELINESSFADQYLWYVGADSISTETQPVINYEVSDTTEYIVSLVTNNNICSDSLSKSLLVYSGGNQAYQSGTEFWFAAPDISVEHANNSVPLNLQVVAYNNTTVTISRPADDDFVPYSFNIAEGQTEEIQLNDNTIFNDLSVDEIETYAFDPSSASFIQDKGFLIESNNGEIGVYYEPEKQLNSEYASLKSQNALGTDFWVSTQRKYQNHPAYSDTWSGFTVVATEDCTVTIDPNGNDLKYHGTSSFTVTLKKGECFAVRANSQDAEDHIFGVHVTSTEDIAIIIYDDSIELTDSPTVWNIFMDQTIPVKTTGKEYLVIRGETEDSTSSSPNAGEAIFVTPTEDGTDIYINGVLKASSLSAGDYFQYTISEEDTATYVRATNPIYVNHVCGYTNYLLGTKSGALGGAVLPPIDQGVGSKDVIVKQATYSGFKFGVNLLVRVDADKKAVANFTYTINGETEQQIDPSHFTYIMDSTFAYYDRFKAEDDPFFADVSYDDLLEVKNSEVLFLLGTMTGNSSPGNKYAYFSDYGINEPHAGIGSAMATATDTVCGLNSVQLVALGGNSYNWSATYEKDSSLTELLSSTVTADPVFTPDTAGVYEFKVLITSTCFTDTTLFIEIVVGQIPNAEFSLSDTAGCSPLTTLISNVSENEEGSYQHYYFYSGDKLIQEIDLDTMATSYSWTTPKNTSDSVEKYTLILEARNKYNSCPVEKYDTVSVYPQLYMAPNPVLEEACTPATILLQSDSVLNVDNINWVVTSLSDTFNVVLGATTPYTYTIDSLGEISSEYTIQAIASNSYNCTDTSSIYSMELLQTPSSDFSFSENPVESGTEVVVYNESSFASEYLWGLGDSTSGEEQLVVQYEVEDSTNYLFSLIAYNESCSDTSMKTLLVYPEVSAEDTTGQSGSSDTTGLGGTGIDDAVLSALVKVYLKSEMITVSWPYDAEYADLTLIDMSGRQRSTLSTMLTNGENITDMSFNANEVYLLQVKTDKRTLMFKVVR